MPLLSIPPLTSPIVQLLRDPTPRGLQCLRPRGEQLSWSGLEAHGGPGGGVRPRCCSPPSPPPSRALPRAHLQPHLEQLGPARTRGPGARPPARPPPHPAASPATSGFVPIICDVSSSPHCRPNHKSFSGRALGRSPHASVEPQGLASETPFPESSGLEGV